MEDMHFYIVAFQNHRQNIIEKMEQKTFLDEVKKEMIEKQLEQCRSDSSKAKIRDRLGRKKTEEKKIDSEEKVKTIESVEGIELI